MSSPANANPLALPHPSELALAPRWRREPYRLLFPVGLLLTWAGVGHWFLLAVGFAEDYRSISHSMAQVQGFLTAFAMGFLLTFVPRRTGSGPPSAVLVGFAALAPICTTVLAFAEKWAWSQISWLALMACMFVFTVRRAFAPAGARRVPASFVWVPFALLMAFAGVVVTGWAAAKGAEWMWLHDVARGAILHGTFTGLVLGVGGLLLPALTHAEPPADIQGGALFRRRLLHLVLAGLFLGSYAIEAVGRLEVAYGARAGVCVLVLAGSARLWRWPRVPGLHRRLAWAAAWCLPLGYALAAAFPGYHKGFLHVVFIGGFGLLTFCVSSHVTLSHGGTPEPLSGRPTALVLAFALLALALAFRLVLAFDQERYLVWLGLASASFLASTLAWLFLVAKPLLVPFSPRPLSDEERQILAAREAEPGARQARG